MSHNIELSTKHPLDEIRDLIQSIDEDSFDIFSDSNIFLLLPDNISINNVKELITKDYNPTYLQKIEFLTFENLAKKIIEEYGKSSSVMPREIFSLLIFESIKEMSKEGNHLGKYFMKLIEDSNSPENHEVIKNIYGRQNILPEERHDTKFVNRNFRYSLEKHEAYLQILLSTER